MLDGKLHAIPNCSPVQFNCVVLLRRISHHELVTCEIFPARTCDNSKHKPYSRLVVWHVRCALTLTEGEQGGVEILNEALIPTNADATLTLKK